MTKFLYLAKIHQPAHCNLAAFGLGLAAAAGVGTSGAQVPAPERAQCALNSGGERHICPLFLDGIVNNHPQL